MSYSQLVSIVLPTYNGSKYIEQSIMSCLEQTYQHWELIIVDDASTDSTPEIIARYAAIDSRIRTLRHEINRQLPGALNTGFSKTRGQYLTWTSDDNFYHPQALEKMLNLLSLNQNVDLVYTDYSIVDDTGSILLTHVVKEPDRLAVGCIVGASFLYRRKIYEVIGNYAEDLFLAEDYDYWLRAFSLFDFASLHINLYSYRRHPNNLATTHKSKILKAGYQAKKRNIPLIIKKLSRYDKALAYLHMARDAKKLGMLFESAGYLIRSYACYPRMIFHKQP